jgi:hypothetical protein
VARGGPSPTYTGATFEGDGKVSIEPSSIARAARAVSASNQRNIKFKIAFGGEVYEVSGMVDLGTGAVSASAQSSDSKYNAEVDGVIDTTTLSIKSGKVLITDNSTNKVIACKDLTPGTADAGTPNTTMADRIPKAAQGVWVATGGFGIVTSNAITMFDDSGNLVSMTPILGYSDNGDGSYDICWPNWNTETNTVDMTQGTLSKITINTNVTPNTITVARYDSMSNGDHHGQMFTVAFGGTGNGFPYKVTSASDFNSNWAGVRTSKLDAWNTNSAQYDSDSNSDGKYGYWTTISAHRPN